MKRDSTILAVTSGKGGAGKSVVAVNLAEALAAAGHAVALVDADLGQGACAVLTNEAPEASAWDYARAEASLAEVIHRTEAGVTLVQGCAEPGAADGKEHRLFAAMDSLLQHLRRTHEFVLIDTPAGTDGAVRWALDRADLGVLVLVGEPTAVADAYRLAKMLWQADPAYPLGAVVNAADDADDAQSIADRFGTITRRFTGQAPSLLGWLPFAHEIRRSVKEQTPAVRTPGPVADAFHTLADVVARGRHAVLAEADPMRL